MLPPAGGGSAAVVTGASSGIGESMAREFARRGYQLVLVARRADRLHELANSLGSGAHVVPADRAGTYAAAKAFVHSYTQAMREELRDTGVSAATLCPGPVHTDFGESAGISKEEAEAALPTFLWTTADRVARAAVDGLAADKAVIVPGAFNRVSTALYHLAPRRLLLPLLARNHPGLKAD